MRYADLNTGDYFKFHDRTYLVGKSFSGNKITFRIDYLVKWTQLNQ